LWSDAQTACQGLGGTLAAVENADEQTAVVNLIAGVDVWIGGNDIATHLTYTWENGATWDYTNWYTSRPKDNSDQDCVKIRQADGKWDNVNCATTRPYICQKAASC